MQNIQVLYYNYVLTYTFYNKHTHLYILTIINYTVYYYML